MSHRKVEVEKEDEYTTQQLLNFAEHLKDQFSRSARKGSNEDSLLLLCKETLKSQQRLEERIEKLEQKNRPQPPQSIH